VVEKLVKNLEYKRHPPADPVKKMFFPLVTSRKISCCSWLSTIFADIEIVAGLLCVASSDDTMPFASVLDPASEIPIRLAGGSSSEASDVRLVIVGAAEADDKSPFSSN
jgi:hypothetical protein